MLKQDVVINMLIGLIFLISGCVMIWIPNRVFSLILTAAICIGFVNFIILAIRWVRHRNNGDILPCILSLVFTIVLLRHQYMPQWIIRVSFGAYCLLSAAACMIQLIINYLNNTSGKFFSFLSTTTYLILGLFLLLNPDFDTELLMQFFGIYAIVLGFRYVNDGTEGINPLTKYEWKRKVRITLPAVVCAFIPDWALSSINSYLETGKPVELESKKTETEAILKVMVHVGPYGFQKVGHISFSYKGIVYSYGNYDSESFHLNQTIGDGVYFKVPFEYYIPNAMEAENNSVFEFGIHVNDEQMELIDKQIEQIEKNSYRWYCQLEREDGYDSFKNYKQDYPSRLHYKTGAKFYKFKKGKFRIYWALGDNCALFVDQILGVLGADVLSVRGIISPGTYLEWLQKEYIKKNSPIISLTIHPWEKKKEEA